MRLTISNLIVSYFSFIIMGFSGFFINMLLASNHNVSVLGLYNFSFALLIVLSQVCVGGLQFSTLKYCTQYSADKEEIGKIISSGFILVICMAMLLIPVSCLILAFCNYYALINHDHLVIIEQLAPAIVLFSGNKVFLSALNGLNWIKSFAFFNILRFVLLSIFVISFLKLHLDVSFLPLIFCGTESCLALVLFIYLLIFFKKIIFPSFYWMKKQIFFASQGFIGGVLMEINTRTDILIVTLFLGYHSAGIYSFASTIAEGFSQIYIVLKNNIDPIIGYAYYNKDFNAFHKAIKQVRKLFVPIIVVMGGVLILMYPYILINWLSLDNELVRSSWPVVNLLIIFYLLGSWTRPFIGMSIQINKPHFFSCFIFLGAITNVILSVLFINEYGLVAVACATGCAFLMESTLLYILPMQIIRSRFNAKS